MIFKPCPHPLLAGDPDGRRRKYINDNVPEELFNYCITPLLIKASIHVNTSGVFRGFHKNKETKIGAWGGTKGNDIDRIKGKIILEI